MKRLFSLIFVLVAASILSSQNVYANDMTGKLGLGLGVTTVGGSPGIGGLKYWVNDDVALSFGGWLTGGSISSGAGISVDGNYVIKKYDRFRLLGIAGVGFGKTTYDSSSNGDRLEEEKETSFGFGVGAEYFFGNNLKWSAESVAAISNIKTTDVYSSGEFEKSDTQVKLGIGLNYYFD